ncbi:hypothetical protein [Streptomyces sp. RFCAC02]|uniref:hypothetical protein n=1 Tax=Streptomyces sp. RFCAC02 TaxID=2499143 RepID=UPI0010204186|nr:hypothetical protein [Streptomyces sp. RFCAC02]
MSENRERTLAFAESPVQMLNIVEWAHVTVPDGLTIAILPPHDPTSRGQLRRMARLARDAGHRVLWREARGGAVAPPKALATLTGPVRRARHLVVGDPFSRYLQLLLSMGGSGDITVVDDGTATMEFVAQLGRGERLVRWHRPRARGPRALLFAPVARRAVRRLRPIAGRRVEVFTAMPVPELPGITVTDNTFAWTRSTFGPPRLTGGADLVGTSLVETGVIAEDRYVAGVAALAAEHGVTRYFAHRRESQEKLHRLTAEAGLEIVRPDFPLELVARRGPIGARVLSFPSTVVHTLPRVLAGTGAEVEICDIADDWFTAGVTERATGFLRDVTETARGTHRLTTIPTQREGTAS